MRKKTKVDVMHLIKFSFTGCWVVYQNRKTFTPLALSKWLIEWAEDKQVHRGASLIKNRNTKNGLFTLYWVPSRRLTRRRPSWSNRWCSSGSWLQATACSHPCTVRIFDRDKPSMTILKAKLKLCILYSLSSSDLIPSSASLNSSSWKPNVSTKFSLIGVIW